jgi:formylmethanofuran dehydrogenase subunit E
MDMDSWERSIAFHGHACCVLAVGYRAARLAIDRLGTLADGECFVALVETADCSTDAIQVLLNCTTGNRHLAVRECGKRVFCIQKSGKAVRIALKPGVISRYGKEYTDLMEKVANGKATPEEGEHFNSWSQPLIKDILQAPPEELFDCQEISPVPLEPGYTFNLFICDRCREESASRYSLLKDGRHLCLECAERER